MEANFWNSDHREDTLAYWIKPAENTPREIHQEFQITPPLSDKERFSGICDKIQDLAEDETVCYICGKVWVEKDPEKRHLYCDACYERTRVK